MLSGIIVNSKFEVLKSTGRSRDGHNQSTKSRNVLRSCMPSKPDLCTSREMTSFYYYYVGNEVCCKKRWMHSIYCTHHSKRRADDTDDTLDTHVVAMLGKRTTKVHNILVSYEMNTPSTHPCPLISEKENSGTSNPLVPKEFMLQTAGLLHTGRRLSIFAFCATISRITLLL